VPDRILYPSYTVIYPDGDPRRVVIVDNHTGVQDFYLADSPDAVYHLAALDADPLASVITVKMEPLK
jgi:hypothetical protein